MRFFSRQTSQVAARVPIGASGTITVTAPNSWGELCTGTGGVSAIACLNCPEEPCRRFLSDELPGLAGAGDTLVCPTDAIRFDPQHTFAVVSDACVHCGLCVLRCPYGSLRLDAERLPTAGPFTAAAYQNVNVTEFEAEIAKFARGRRPNTAALRQYVEQAVSDLRSAQQATFYPLVGRMLTAAGLPTWLPRRGDTNNRIDAIIAHPAQSIPIEIKSPTETLFINVKSVQQALENKVILRRRLRAEFPTTPETASLVIGYEYPAVRSDVTELAEDIRATYNVRIGLIDLRSLLTLVVEVYRTGQPIAIDRIATLEGPL